MFSRFQRLDGLSSHYNLELRGGFALGLGRAERLQIMLTELELGAVDEWRFTRRMPSRASAIREPTVSCLPINGRGRRISGFWRNRSASQSNEPELRHSHNGEAV